MRILILRTSAMGDIVHSLPVLAAIKRAMPDARVAWVAEKPFAPLLSGHPDLDEVFSVELRRWRRRLSQGIVQVIETRRAIDDFDTDVALDLMGNHKAGAIAALVRAPRVIGLRREDRREPSSAGWMTETVSAHGPHAVDRALSVVRGLGIDPGTPDFQAQRILPGPAEAGSEPPEQPYFVVQVGTGWINKTYPAAAWGEVARRIAQRHDIIGYVAYGPGEDDDAKAAIAAADGALAGSVPPGLVNLAAWLRSARLVLGGDTGPLHLADALGIPVLIVMGPTGPDGHGPYNQRSNVLRIDLPCSPCNRRFTTTQSCMTRLPPTAVADSAIRLLCGQRLTAQDTMLRLTEPQPPLCRAPAHRGAAATTP